ncbi:MAG: SRPBCC domain-containing protein [Gammaproteobacteria bacterium]
MRRLLVLAALLPMMSLAQNTASVEVTVPASSEKVWRLLTTDKGQASWLYPGAEIDLKNGGYMRSGAADGQKLDLTWPLNGEIQTFEPGRMLSLADAGPATPSGSADKPWCVIYLQPISDQQTQIRVSAMGYPDTAYGLALMARFKNEYQAALDRLAVHLGATPVAAKPAVKPASVVPAAAPAGAVASNADDIDREMTKEEVEIKEAEEGEIPEKGGWQKGEEPLSVSDHFIPD